jgi:hypothetical protein
MLIHYVKFMESINLKHLCNNIRVSCARILHRTVHHFFKFKLMHSAMTDFKRLNFKPSYCCVVECKQPKINSEGHMHIFIHGICWQSHCLLLRALWVKLDIHVSTVCVHPAYPMGINMTCSHHTLYISC